MKTTELVAERSGERLDLFIARKRPAISRSRARRLIDEGLVRVDGALAKASLRVAAGSRVVVQAPEEESASPQAEEMPLSVVYQDGDIIVVDKPAGITVHPAPGHATGTLVNGLLAAYPELRESEEQLRPGIVHRLDKDTSGLIVVARNDRARRALQAQLKEREVKKVYLALVRGVPDPRKGLIEAPIARNPKNRKKMAVVAGGREASTRYRVLKTVAGGAYSLVEVEPVTGRTHQIRVHMSAIGHPVVGDATYGRRSHVVGRQFLHAARLAFTLPASGRMIELESPLPSDLRGALRQLEAVRED